MKKKNSIADVFTFVFLAFLSILFLIPIFVVLLNSFKGKFYISKNPFLWPSGDAFAGFDNYVNGIIKSGFIKAMGYSFFITSWTSWFR